MTSVMTVQAPGVPSGWMTEVVLLRPTASDTEAVLGMVGRCSRASLFHRFHGFTDGMDYFGELFRDRPLEQTLLAWHRSMCVGVATLGAGTTGVFDLGVLVEDAWQRRGIGTHLAESLVDCARARGLSTVHADVLGDDLFILESLRRIGPLTVSIESGSYSIDVELGSEPRQPSRIASRLVRTETGGDCRRDWTK
jgi:GNAT superfamily N-acetyltransferase